MSEEITKGFNQEKQKEQAKKLAFLTANILYNKKAKDVKILSVSEQTIIADYFVIAGGSSSTQVNSLADEVEFKLSEENILPARIEGKNSGSWILLDYHSVLVHVFSSEQRDFYKLERLWADGEEIDFIPDDEKDL